MNDLEFIEVYAEHDNNHPESEGCSICEEYQLRFAPQYDEEWLAEAYMDQAMEEEFMEANGDKWYAMA